MFLEALKNEETCGCTENGAKTFTSTLNANLDFFAMASAKRGDLEGAIKLFEKALIEDTKLAIINLFYLRDIRGGQGERAIFRSCLQKLPINVLTNEDFIHLIPEYGRWDDLECLFDSSLTKDVALNVIEKQYHLDIQNQYIKQPSLLAKWIPLPNSVSNKRRKRIGFEIIQKLFNATSDKCQGMFRKNITQLRKQLHIVEQNLSEKTYLNISYSTVPSCAFNKYKKAFLRNDYVHFNHFLMKVMSGKEKINANCIYPHQIIHQVRTLSYHENVQTLEEMWKALSDFEIKRNILTVVDVSGSMYCSISSNTSVQAIDVSLGIGLYTAEKNKGKFGGHIISFSESPKLIDVHNGTLKDKIRKIEHEGMGYNTDLQAVFDLILSTIRNNNIPIEEQPSTILIISDMEFDDPYVENAQKKRTNFEVIKDKYNSVGVKCPQLVFWNVASRNKNVPVRQNEQGVILVSGLSPVTLKFISSESTPLDFMMEILNSERYKPIRDLL